MASVLAMCEWFQSASLPDRSATTLHFDQKLTLRSRIHNAILNDRLLAPTRRHVARVEVRQGTAEVACALDAGIKRQNGQVGRPARLSNAAQDAVSLGRSMGTGTGYFYWLQPEVDEVAKVEPKKAVKWRLYYLNPVDSEMPRINRRNDYVNEPFADATESLAQARRLWPKSECWLQPADTEPALKGDETKIAWRAHYLHKGDRGT